MKHLLIVIMLLASMNVVAQDIAVAVHDDITIRLPDSTVIAGSNRRIDWGSISAIASLVRDTASLKLQPGLGVELEIWVHQSEEYVTGVNNLTRTQWLTFVTQMMAIQAQDATKRHGKMAVAAMTGEYVGERYRAILGRTTWPEGNAFHSVILFDVFHEKELVSFLFTWTAPEGSETQRLVDQILTSITTHP